MTDFEDELRESLRDRAGEMPPTDGLADGARRRLRRRRTASATAGVVAAVVVVAPFAFLDREQTPTGIATGTDPASPSASASVAVPDDGLRTESWHDITFEVPDSWGYGAPTGQCFSSASFPTVGRPSDIAPSVDCAGPGYGASVGPADLYEPASGDVWQYSAPAGFEPRYPDLAWVSIWYDDDVAVTVVTPDKSLTETIAGSVRVIDGFDDNGCAPLLGDVEAAVSDGTDTVSVCRYDDADALEWSRRLSGAESATLSEAIRAAPMRTVDYDCPSEDGLSRTAVLDGGAYLATVVTDAVLCDGWNGIFLSGAVREITDDVRAALERPVPTG